MCIFTLLRNVFSIFIYLIQESGYCPGCPYSGGHNGDLPRGTEEVMIPSSCSKDPIPHLFTHSEELSIFLKHAAGRMYVLAAIIFSNIQLIPNAYIALYVWTNAYSKRLCSR